MAMNAVGIVKTGLIVVGVGAGLGLIFAPAVTAGGIVAGVQGAAAKVASVAGTAASTPVPVPGT